MSTKIYTAYRTKDGVDIWKLMIGIKMRGRKEVAKVLRTFYHNLLLDGEKSPKVAREHRDKGEPITPFICSQFVRKLYKDQLGDPRRHPFNFDVSVTVRKKGRRYYLIPYCDMLVNKALDFLKEDVRLEDFSYWDNTDPPKGFTWASWRRRGRVWYPMLEHERWPEFLTIDIMDIDSFTFVEPSLEMMKEKKYKKNKEAWLAWHDKNRSSKSKTKSASTSSTSKSKARSTGTRKSPKK